MRLDCARGVDLGMGDAAGVERKDSPMAFVLVSRRTSDARHASGLYTLPITTCM